MPDLGLATFDEILQEFNDRGETVVMIRLLLNKDRSGETEHRITDDLVDQRKLVVALFLKTAQRLDPTLRIDGRQS